MSQDTLVHATLNRTLRGKPSTLVTQFRNLKYASIPARWRDAIATDSLSSNGRGFFDATKFGPSCPHKRGAQAWDASLVGDNTMPLGEGHVGKDEHMNELECLHLNIVVPNSTLEQKRNGGRKGLPVFVWVHGGGLSMGSNSWPQYDLTRFVEQSIESGKPIIGVSINYRVGVFGFLASEELGIDGNFGYKDQVLAFKWIKKHIAGFGGNPNDITAAGESAGGIALSTLLCANVGDEGLFERVVIMSGEATLRKPRSRLWHEKMYHEQLKFLGLEKISVEERKRWLRDAQAEELTDKLPLAQHFCACIDGRFLRENVTLKIVGDGKQKLHKPDWCKEFVVGDTAHDGTVLKWRILDNPNAVNLLKAACAQNLLPSETASLLSSYKLPASSPEQEKRSILELASELRFYLPSLIAQSGWKSVSPSKYSRRYHFHVPNPVEGMFTGLASHELDVAFLFQNFTKHFDDKSNQVARQMARQWIDFANGEGWCEAGSVVVVGHEGIEVVDEHEYDRRFRGGRGKVLGKIGTEKLWRLAEAWQGVRSEEMYEAARASL